MYILSPTEGIYFQYDIVNRLTVQICNTFTYRRHLFSVWYCQSSDSPDMYIISPTEHTYFQYDIVNRLTV